MSDDRSRRVPAAAIAFLAALCGTAPVWPATPAAQALPTPLPPARPRAPDTDVLPADNAVSGWTRSGAPRVFTQADLYGYIDGGAELFLELGFEQLRLQKYRRGQSEIVVDLYRMRDADAALGIYLMKCGKETPDRSLRERHTVNRYQLSLQRDCFFAILNNPTGEVALVPDLVRLASALASRLPAARPSRALAALPPTGLVPGTQRLLRGPFGLQAVFTLGEGDVMQLGGTVTAASAEFDDAHRGRHTLIVAPYPSAAAANAAFGHLRQNLDPSLKTVSATPTRLVFQDFEDRFGEVTVESSRVVARLHLAKRP